MSTTALERTSNSKRNLLRADGIAPAGPPDAMLNSLAEADEAASRHGPEPSRPRWTSVVDVIRSEIPYVVIDSAGSGRVGSGEFLADVGSWCGKQEQRHSHRDHHELITRAM